MNKKDLREEYVTGGQGSERINGEEITLLPESDARGVSLGFS